MQINEMFQDFILIIHYCYLIVVWLVGLIVAGMEVFKKSYTQLNYDLTTESMKIKY